MPETAYIKARERGSDSAASGAAAVAGGVPWKNQPAYNAELENAGNSGSAVPDARVLVCNRARSRATLALRAVESFPLHQPEPPKRTT